MIKLEELTEMLQNGLNDNQKGERFLLGTDVEEFHKQQGKAIDPSANRPTRGVVRALSGKFAPIKDLNNYNVVLLLELIVQEQKLNTINEILGTYITLNVGETTDMNGYQVVINFDVPTVGTANFGTVGYGVPVQVVVYYQFIQNALYGNSVKYYFVNGEVETPIIFSENSAGKEFTSAAYQPMNAVTATSLNSQNSGNLSMMIYALNSAPYVSLMQAILNDTGQNTVYRIKTEISDIISAENDYILSSGSIHVSPGSPVMIKCVFSRAHEFAEA